MSRDTNNLPADWTPLQKAAYLTVHQYRRNGNTGAAAMAPLVGKSPATISNEVNPAMDSHKLGLLDSVLYQHLADDHRILHTMAAELGFLNIPYPDFDPVSDVALLNAFADWQSAMGMTCTEIKAALEDGRITGQEVAAIKTAGQRHMGRFLQFLQRMESLVDD